MNKFEIVYSSVEGKARAERIFCHSLNEALEYANKERFAGEFVFSITRIVNDIKGYGIAKQTINIQLNASGDIESVSDIPQNVKIVVKDSDNDITTYEASDFEVFQQVNKMYV